MHYPQIFLTTLSLTTLSLALPSTNPPQARDDQSTVGIPPDGINCQTDSEGLHNLTADMIQTTMTTGAQIITQSYGTNKFDNGTIVYFPAPFNQTTFMNPSWPAFNAAPGCDLTQKDIWYMPLWYPGTTQPDNTGTRPSPDYPGVPVTTDIVVFESVFQGFVATAQMQFCAVLTNSDAVGQNAELALFTDPDPTVQGFTLNTSPGGYRQCNANA